MISSMIRSTMNTALLQTLRGDPQEAPALPGCRSPGVKNRFRTAVNTMMNSTGFSPRTRDLEPYPGDADDTLPAHSQPGCRSATQALGAEQRHDVPRTTSRIFVRGSSRCGQGVAGEKLAQGDVLKHAVSPPSAAPAAPRSRPAPRCRPPGRWRGPAPAGAWQIRVTCGHVQPDGQQLLRPGEHLRAGCRSSARVRDVQHQDTVHHSGRSRPCCG